MRAVYFAWVRERIGKTDEPLAPPEKIRTVGDLIGWLRERDEGYAHAFERPNLIRVAVDRRHAKHDAPIAGAQEIAFFPPMTGG